MDRMPEQFRLSYRHFDAYSRPEIGVSRDFEQETCLFSCVNCPVVGFFPHFIATGRCHRISCFDAYPLPWSSLGSITCPLVYLAKKRLQHPDISELAVSEMRQNGQDMGQGLLFAQELGMLSP
jgi:hypothetical protein